MARKIFDFNGDVSQWGFSLNYVRNCISQTKKDDEVIFRVSSYGGDFFESMAISAEFAKHGNVSVEIVGYAASAATILAMGAKNVSISSPGFFLVHPVSSWVDAWGVLNSDEIRAKIAELEKSADENERLTFSAVNLYAKKTGKDPKVLLDLMKEERWLSSEEAKEWGFVDDIVEEKDVPMASAKYLNLMHLPEIPKVNSENESFWNKMKSILNGVKAPEITHEQKETFMYEKVNAVLGVEKLEGTKEGVFLSCAQLELLEKSLDESQSAKDLAAKLDAIHPDIQSAADKVAKIKEMLTSKPSAEPSVQISNKEEGGEIDWAKLGCSHMCD